MSSQPKPLGQLNPGDRGTILSISCQGPLRRRLMDMGLTPGTEVIVEGAAPLGDPMVICARGCRLGLRRAEAGAIAVMPCPGICRQTPIGRGRPRRGPRRNRWRHGRT